MMVDLPMRSLRAVGTAFWKYGRPLFRVKPVTIAVILPNFKVAIRKLPKIYLESRP